MAKPLVEFPDPEAAVLAYLDGAFIGPLASRMPATISTRPPQTALAVGTQWVQVEHDGSFVEDHPATERATVRINCYAAPGKRSDVKALASLVSGLLAIHPGDDNVWGTTPLVGRSQVLTDPDTKNLMCWFTYRVNLRPAQIPA